MRIMLDTNVLLSALLFPGPNMDELFRRIVTEHRLVLSSYVIDELFTLERPEILTPAQFLARD